MPLFGLLPPGGIFQRFGASMVFPTPGAEGINMLQMFPC